MSKHTHAGWTLSALVLSAPLAFAEPPVETEDDLRRRIGSGNPLAGKAKSETELCQGCHGEDGFSIAAGAPNLAGQQAEYIIKQIADFRAQRRLHRIMNPMAEGVPEADVPDIAAYFASQPRMTGDTSPGNEVGRNLFLYGDVEREIPACVECHDLGGKGKVSAGVVYPRIGGQIRGYLRLQLFNWKHGYRANSPNNVMNKIAGALTEEEMAALAEYVSGL